VWRIKITEARREFWMVRATDAETVAEVCIQCGLTIRGELEAESNKQ